MQRTQARSKPPPFLSAFRNTYVPSTPSPVHSVFPPVSSPHLLSESVILRAPGSSPFDCHAMKTLNLTLSVGTLSLERATLEEHPGRHALSQLEESAHSFLIICFIA
uniref:Uncharacterized protein n=1 Tax=Odontella aurita TaxID=265563 RepID=A0A7S4NE47_9STRA